jgi:hypothetical protein
VRRQVRADAARLEQRKKEQRKVKGRHERIGRGIGSRDPLDASQPLVASRMAKLHQAHQPQGDAHGEEGPVVHRASFSSCAVMPGPRPKANPKPDGAGGSSA